MLTNTFSYNHNTNVQTECADIKWISMKAKIYLLITVACLCVTYTKLLSANYDGDIILGALFPIHERHAGKQPPCGVIQEQDGIQPLEALMYTLDYINNSTMLPGFTLGAIALDSCDSEAYALDQAVEFIQILVIRITEAAGNDQDYVCSNGERPDLKPGAHDFHSIVGVLGGSTSAVSIRVASLLQLFHVPQISYLSTSPDLSNQERFKYFQRTVPSDLNQAKAILYILKAFNWTYVSAVYEDSNYGVKGFGELEKLMEEEGICFGAIKKIQLDQNPTKQTYMDIVRDLDLKVQAKVVVVFTDFPQARRLFEAVNERRLIDRFIWIGSDGWSARQLVVENLEEIVNKAITVQPLIENLLGFDDYFTSINPSKNARNPWFQEYWEQYFQCRFPKTVYEGHGAFSKVCTGNEKINEKSGYTKQMFVHFVKDAVYAFAQALKDIHADVCGRNTTGLCSDMKPGNLSGEQLLKYVKRVNFTDPFTNKQFSFVDGVDGPPRYSVMVFDKEGDEYRWKSVGTWDGTTNRFYIDSFLLDKSKYPESFCSSVCSQQQAKTYTEGGTCCWICTNCTEEQILTTPEKCVSCEPGTWPNEARNRCDLIAETHMDYANPFAIGAYVFAILGISGSMTVAYVFWIYRETPIIKASGRELSFVLLAGITLSYAVTFIFVSPPSEITCGLTRFFTGICYTLCYGAILTKTNRISRIFNQNSGIPTKAKYTDPKSQIVIVTVIVAIEIVILVVWLITFPPKTTHIYPNRRDNLLVCNDATNASYLIALIFPLLLVIVCTIYAFKTRKTPDGFNESRCIAFANYTTCIIWLAFVPIYFTSQINSVRIFTLCLSVSLSGTVQLMTLFMPKIYTVIYRPDKNTRDAVMSDWRSTGHLGSGSGSQNMGSQIRHVHLGSSIPSDNRSFGIPVDESSSISYTTTSDCPNLTTTATIKDCFQAEQNISNADTVVVEARDNDLF